MIKHKRIPRIGETRTGRAFAWFPRTFMEAWKGSEGGLMQTTVWLEYYNYTEEWYGFDRGGWHRIIMRVP